MEQPESENAGEQRVRKHHTRSRIGCLTCKKRHLRCDGNQPTCHRCKRGGKPCSYSTPDPPLRERRGLSLPGEQRPWSLIPAKLQPTLSKRLPGLNMLEPFDCLPIRMTHRSTELLRYYHQIDNNFDITSKARERDVLKFVIQNPTSIRYTLLVAGLHYLWITGDTKKFDSTVLFHKVEALHMLNKELQVMQPADCIALVKHVATLCLIEIGLGNMSTAEVHLDGLVAILENFHLISEDNTECGFEEELAYRYLILAYNYVHNMKSRMKESKDLGNMVTQPLETNMKDFHGLITGIHEQDMGCLRIQLRALSMYPFFFPNLPPTTKFHDIDASVFVVCLRSLTNVTESDDSDHVLGNPSWAWVEGSIARLHLAITNTHVASIFNKDQGPSVDPVSGQRLISSWCSMATINGLYMHSVLGIWNANQPMGPQLLRLVMRILMRDFDKPSQKPKIRQSPDLWLWQRFVTAYFLTVHQLDAYDYGLQAAEQYFDRSLYHWSQTFNTTNWDQVHKRLLKITWPSNHSEDLPKFVWQRALRRGESNASEYN